MTLPIAPIALHEPRDSNAPQDVGVMGVELAGVTLVFPNGVRAHFGRGSEGMLMEVLTKA